MAVADRPRLLILGAGGKLGTALAPALAGEGDIETATSRDLDALDLEAVAAFVRARRPSVVVNCIAKMGIPACEQDPVTAFRLNTLLPGTLADLSRELGFRLCLFSTDSVFPDHPDAEAGAYRESDAARPLNTYGITKFGGDCMVLARAPSALVVRVSILFGPSPKGNQFLERMLERAARGETLSAAHDVIASPTYSVDVATRVRDLLRDTTSAGLYHVANAGRASLHELVSAAVAASGYKAEVRAASHTSFPTIGVKNQRTPLVSTRLPALRPWSEALGAYCRQIAP